MVAPTVLFELQKMCCSLLLSSKQLGLYPNYIRGRTKRRPKTYNSGYWLVVNHLTTNPPERCLNRAERTRNFVFNVLWSYVKEMRGRISIQQETWNATQLTILLLRRCFDAQLSPTAALSFSL
jgi:hypothetical protein